MIVLVTKVNNGVGATTLSFSLAKKMNALYIDADVRHPRYPNKGGWLAWALGGTACGLRAEVINDSGVRALPGGDAYLVYAGLCDDVEKSELYDKLLDLLQRLEEKNINVVVDIGALSERVLSMFKHRYKIVYIDDARLFAPSERQKTTADIADIIVINKSTIQRLPEGNIKRKVLAVVPPDPAHIEEVADALARVFRK